MKEYTKTYKKTKPSNGNLIKKRTPIKKNKANRIITKQMHWRCSKRNIRSNKGPHITKVSLKPSKDPIVFLTPQDSEDPHLPQKLFLLLKEQMGKELLNHLSKTFVSRKL